MPKPGFTAITVSASLKERLSETARALGFCGVPSLIESLLTITSTGTSTNGGNIPQQISPNQAPFPKNNLKNTLGLPAFPASRGRRPH